VSAFAALLRLLRSKREEVMDSADDTSASGRSSREYRYELMSKESSQVRV
jgi:hypothetical protein